jgi:Mrp family chromosome partitioning ATPase
VPNAPTTAEETPRLQDYLRPIGVAKWLILAAVCVATVATYLISASRPDRYQASTQVFISAGRLDLTADPGGTGVEVTDRDVQNQAILLDSLPVAERARKATSYAGSARSLLKRIAVKTNANADFITVTANDRTARGAADIANGMVDAYVALRRGQVAGAIERSLSRARAELSAAKASGVRGVDLVDVRQRVRNLELLRSVPPGPASQVQPAVAPGHPASPRPKRNAAFAFILSLFFSVLAAYGLDRLDRRFRHLDELEGAFGVPLIGAFPSIRRPISVANGVAHTNDKLREAFRALRINLELSTVDNPAKRILVTSSVAGEGKTTIVAGLAMVYRELGMRVAVIDTDLRRQGVARMLGFEGMAKPGLASVLTGRLELIDALVSVPVDVPGLDELLDARTNGRSPNAHEPRTASGDAAAIDLLPGGIAPPNPQALLATDRMRQLIDQVAEDFDVVLIDTPPILVVSDATPLLPIVDSIVLVARVEQTTRDVTRRLHKHLDLVPHAPIAGVVANNVDMNDNAMQYYGYDAPTRRGLFGRAKHEVSSVGAP